MFNEQRSERSYSSDAAALTAVKQLINQMFRFVCDVCEETKDVEPVKYYVFNDKFGVIKRLCEVCASQIIDKRIVHKG